MSAKESLLSTLSVLKECLSDPSLIDKAPTEISHNLRASLLRQGLAVLVFSTLETFIRERTGEVLGSFTNRRLIFSDLSPALQKACTLGALEGVRFRLKLKDSQDKIPWLVSALPPIFNATSRVIQLSGYSFAHAASNLTESDVKDILKAFGVDNPWMQMTQLTSRIGLAVLDCETDFEAIKKRRHSAAHALASTVLHSDLTYSIRSALAICIAFDLLLSHAKGLLNLRMVPGQGGRPALSQADIELVFAAPRPHTFDFGVAVEQLPPPAPILRRSTIRVFPDASAALNYGTAYSIRRKKNLLQLDATSTPIYWQTW